MKECMRGTGGSSGNFEGKPDDGSGTSGLNIPGRCVGCPYVEGVTREHAADVGLEEERKDVVHRCVSALLRHVEHTDKLQKELDLIVDGLWADVKENKRSITEAAQREIDEVTADCPGAAIATAADQNAGFRGCDSPTLDGGVNVLVNMFLLTDIIQI